ncbi:hypothetical protein MKEN_00039900 [Mycena kentingensis (nom. inval.)]|nr:hypothetical protein MKEN_00039900 [Mycena kentingensis (nom. inval.)]
MMASTWQVQVRAPLGVGEYRTITIPVPTGKLLTILEAVEKEEQAQHYRFKIHATKTKMTIIQFMPEPAYDAAAAMMTSLLWGFEFQRATVAQSPTILGTYGRMRFLVNGVSEPDGCIVPDSRNIHTDWPTVVIEVGYNETIPELYRRADDWLQDSGGAVQLVILTKIFAQTRRIALHFLVHSQQKNNNLPFHATPVLPALNWSEETLATTQFAPIDIPAHLVYDVVPANVAVVTISAMEVGQYVRRIFRCIPV